MPRVRRGIVWDAVSSETLEEGVTRTASDDVLEADVEGGVGVRGECVAILANNVLGLVVIVAHGIADLQQHQFCPGPSSTCRMATYVHVQLLTISPVAVDNGGDDDELVLCDEVPHAALVLLRFVAVVGLHVQLEGGSIAHEGNEQQQKAAEPRDSIHAAWVGWQRW
jgi:hypothetical protein